MNQPFLSGFHEVDLHEGFDAVDFRELLFGGPAATAASLGIESEQNKVDSLAMTDDLEPTPIEFMSWPPKTKTAVTLTAQEMLAEVSSEVTRDFAVQYAQSAADDDEESIGTIDVMKRDFVSFTDDVNWSQSPLTDGGASYDQGSFEGNWEVNSDNQQLSQKLDKKLDMHDKSNFRGSTNDRKTRSWQQSYELLIIFKGLYGHTNVSVHHAKERRFKGLLQWIKRQRYHRKLLDEGKPSPLSLSRMQLLDSVGFVWNNHAVVWEAKFEMLVAFRRITGHCNVPRSYPQNPALASWVKRQRQCYSTGMIDFDRIERLNRIGFIWVLSHHKAMST